MKHKEETIEALRNTLLNTIKKSKARKKALKELQKVYDITSKTLELSMIYSKELEKKLYWWQK